MSHELGFAAVARKIRAHWVWEPGRKRTRAEAWLDLILEAEWKPTKILIKGLLIDVPRGGLAASERYLSDRWKWSATMVRNFLRHLVADGMIKHERVHESKRAPWVITLLNYETYNPRACTKEAPVSARTSAREEHEESENNKGNKGTKSTHTSRAHEALGDDSSEIPPVTLKAAISAGQQMAITEEIVTAWYHDRDSVGWMHKGQPITRWQSNLKAYHAAWQRNEKPNNGTNQRNNRGRRHIDDRNQGTQNAGKADDYRSI